MFIPATQRTNDVRTFAKGLSLKSREREGTSRQKVEEQNYYSKLCEVSVAEFCNERLGTDYTVDLNVYNRAPSWAPDIVSRSDRHASLEVKTSTAESRTWTFQYPYHFVKYPHAKDSALVNTRVDKKLLYPERFGETLIALTTYYADTGRVSWDYLLPLDEVVRLLRPMKNRRFDLEKSALYEKDLNAEFRVRFEG